MKAVIMRGASGSGKDFWVSKNTPDDALIFSTDNYHFIDGQYVFQQEKLGEFHDRCLLEFVEACQESRPFIVCNNTNIRASEFVPYYKVAKACGYDVEIVWVISSPEFCKERTQHRTPPHVIDSMFANIEPVPFGWRLKVIINDGRL